MSRLFQLRTGIIRTLFKQCAFGRYFRDQENKQKHKSTVCLCTSPDLHLMNFQRGKQNDEPEINLVPMIDVLLVILIFLVVTTTYSKFTELEITLPQTSAEQVDQNVEKPNRIDITVNALGEYTINMSPIKSGASIESLRDALWSAANNREDPFVVINADAKATHQSVITIMEAARLAGYNKITFATETDNPKH